MRAPCCFSISKEQYMEIFHGTKNPFDIITLLHPRSTFFSTFEQTQKSLNAAEEMEINIKLRCDITKLPHTSQEIFVFNIRFISIAGDIYVTSSAPITRDEAIDILHNRYDENQILERIKKQCVASEINKAEVFCKKYGLDTKSQEEAKTKVQEVFAKLTLDDKFTKDVVGAISCSIKLIADDHILRETIFDSSMQYFRETHSGSEISGDLHPILEFMGENGEAEATLFLG